MQNVDNCEPKRLETNLMLGSARSHGGKRSNLLMVAARADPAVQKLAPNFQVKLNFKKLVELNAQYFPHWKHTRMTKRKSIPR